MFNNPLFECYSVSWYSFSGETRVVDPKLDYSVRRHLVSGKITSIVNITLFYLLRRHSLASDETTSAIGFTLLYLVRQCLLLVDKTMSAVDLTLTVTLGKSMECYFKRGAGS